MIPAPFIVLGCFVLGLLALVRLMPILGKLFAQGFQREIKADLKREETEFINSFKAGGKNCGKEKEKKF